MAFSSFILLFLVNMVEGVDVKEEEEEQVEEIRENQNDLGASSSSTFGGQLAIQPNVLQSLNVSATGAGEIRQRNWKLNPISKLELESVCGYRFSPDDRQLVVHYLARKIMGLPLSLNIIKEIDVYKNDPDHLPIDEFKHSKSGEAFFFSRRVRKVSKNPKSKRTRRTTGNGYWRCQGRETTVYHRNMCFGYKKTMVFYRGKPPTGEKTHWIMNEYRLNPLIFRQVCNDELLNSKVENYVACRIQRKINYTTTT